MNKIQEYLDCSNNLRHYSNHQVALITALMAINGAIAALVFSSNTLTGFFEDIGAKIIALALSILFSIKIQSAIMMWDHFFNRAIELEMSLKLKHYTTLPGFPIFPIRPAKWAMQIFSVSTIVFWFLSLLNQW